MLTLWEKERGGSPRVRRRRSRFEDLIVGPFLCRCFPASKLTGETVFSNGVS